MCILTFTDLFSTAGALWTTNEPMPVSSDLVANRVTMSSQNADINCGPVAVIQQLPSFTVQNLLSQSAIKTERVAVTASSSDLAAVTAAEMPSLQSDITVENGGHLANIFGRVSTPFQDRQSQQQQQNQSAYGHQSMFYGYAADNGLAAASPAATSATSIDSAFYSPYGDGAGASTDGGHSLITSPCDISGYMTCAPSYKPMQFSSALPDVDVVGPLFQATVADYADSRNNSPEVASALLTQSGYIGGIIGNSGHMLASATGSNSTKPSFGGISHQNGQMLRESSSVSSFLDVSSASVGHGLDGTVGSFLSREDLYFASAGGYATAGRQTITHNYGDSEFDAATNMQRPPASTVDDRNRANGIFY
jgi:hypothetical protein